MHHFTRETENIEIYDATKKYELMAASNSLQRLICYNEWRKYHACHVASILTIWSNRIRNC